MSTIFEASNGVKVIPHDTSIGVRLSIRDEDPVDVPGYARTSVETYLDPRQVDALRECFDFASSVRWQATRDAELGRWRWPENPDYVVYLDQGDALVVSESDPRKSPDRISRRYCDDPAGSLGWGEFAARAYFEAHPERKPWYDAKPGELWSLGIGGGYHNDSIAVIDSRDGPQFIWAVKNGHVRIIPVTDRSIDYGTRVFPKDES